MKTRTFGLVIAALVACFGALGWAVAIWNENVEPASVESSAQGPGITSDFELVDQNGRTVRDEDFPDKWQLVFFGFASCPDICPTTLDTVTTALEQLGPEAGKLQPFLMTVDPERDTSAVLKDYLSSFDSRILGLTGTAEQVQAATRSFRVYASKRPLEDGDYTMDHSTFIYLMNPAGDYVKHFGAQTNPSDMAKAIREAMNDQEVS